ncbi:MAG: hypothetical protein ABI551_00185 [Polyangiaceae bacterium]
MSNLSPNTKALLRAARHDSPSRDKRAAMWTGVTGGLVTHTPLTLNVQGAAPPAGPVAGPVAAPVAVPPPPPSAPIGIAAAKSGLLAGASMKGAFIGALFGSAISIGVATFMLRSKSADPPVPVQTVVVTSPEKGSAPPSTLPANMATNGAANSMNLPVEPKAASTAMFEIAATPAVTPNARSTVNSDESSISNASGALASTTKPSPRSHHDGAASTTPKTTTSNDSLDGLLSKEVGLVAEARRELLLGDAAAALKSVRAARSLEARQLEPEEMSLEARALRALARDVEAAKVENQLRSSYPDTTLR